MSFLRTCWLALLIANLMTSPRVHVEDFVLRESDTVVFLGDSLTAAGTYGKFIENYSLLRNPNRKVRFINARFGGDTAEGGLKRLDRDVFAHKATVLMRSVFVLFQTTEPQTQTRQTLITLGTESGGTTATSVSHHEGPIARKLGVASSGSEKTRLASLSPDVIIHRVEMPPQLRWWLPGRA